MKYITPSIEVVNFNSSDAPRIGMQWWYQVTPYGGSVAESWTAAPSGWAPSSMNGDLDTLTPGAQLYGVVTDLSHVMPCTAVQRYTCVAENIAGAYAYPDGENRIADDFKSC